MAIIIITIIFRLIVAPLMHMQIKSSYAMQKVNPKLQEIKEKYQNDPQRMQSEMQKLYAEANFNPVLGCLPLLLQMPIFIALFQVLQEMGARTAGQDYRFYHLINNLTTKPAEAFAQGFLDFIPYLILLLIFAVATFIPMLLQQAGGPDNAQKRQMLIMGGVMSIFMLWVGWGSPAGVLLYWGASSIIGIAQQQITMAIFRKRDEKQEAESTEVKPVEVDVTRRTKKKRPTKSR